MGIKTRFIYTVYKNILSFTFSYFGNTLLKLESQILKNNQIYSYCTFWPNNSSQISKIHEKTSSGEIFSPLIYFYDRVMGPVN